MSKFDDIRTAVMEGNADKAKSMAEIMLAAGEDPLKIIEDGLIAGMDVVGARFKEGDMFVPEVMMCAKAMSVGVEAVRPAVKGGEIASAGVVVIGTVQGDLHDIGKNLVAMILRSAGFDVIDIGVDNSPQKFVEAIKENNAQVVGLSALLTTTMPAMKDTIDAIAEAGLRDKVKIMIGGAPVSHDFADEIGADGYGDDAVAARDLCGKLVS